MCKDGIILSQGAVLLTVGDGYRRTLAKRLSNSEEDNMSYLVFCTFDLKGASSQDYQNAYADLEKIGLKKVHKNGQGGNSVIPTTAAMGFFDGNSASTVCTDIRDRVQAAFRARRFKSELFFVAGGDWAWIASAT